MPKVKKRKLLHPPHNLFKAYLAEHGIKLKEIAAIADSSLNSISQKNNGYQNYTMSEVDAICSHYGISADIFRFKKVS
jgi:hypothetical protein